MTLRMCSITKNSLFTIFCLTLLSIVSGCTEDPESQNYVNVGLQYELKLHQSLTADGGIPALQVKTIEPQNCQNAFISHHTLIDKNKVKIFLNNIVVEGDCITGQHIISETLPLATSHDQLPLEINLKEAIDNYGVIKKSEDKINLELHKFDGLKITRTSVNKIKAGMFWGSFTVDNDEMKSQISTFFQGLDTTQEKLKGDYGYFYLSPDAVLTIYDQENSNSFFIESVADLDFIQAKVLEFKEKEPSLVFKATYYDGSTINVR